MSISPTPDDLDPFHDILKADKHPLDAIFKPQNVAVIGATEKQGSVGRTVLWNLISNPFGGTILPVNPKRPNVLGIKSYPSIKDVPEQVDLAVIVTPAPTVPGIIEQCIEAGVRGAIIISAGFKEMGPKGEAYEQEILKLSRASGMRIIGPNCLGVMMPRLGMNATFAASMATPGNVGFISQSGALCTAVLDWSEAQQLGFSAFISIGSMVDVSWGDLIDYLGNDPNTSSIVMYMESIGNARAFISAAREVALSKPIIVIKAGRTAAAAKAAASHTGSLTGSDDVLQSAFRRCGVIRVNQIEHLFYLAETLAKQPRPQGPNMTIVTNAGGPGVLATDTLILGGGELTQISDEAMEEFNSFLPEHWSHNNPIDVLGDAGPDRYARSLEVAARDKNSDGMMVILTPQDMTDSTKTAEALKEYSRIEGKPVLASWMGGVSVAAGQAILNRANIPTFPYPDLAAQVFNYMWQYSYNLRGLYETPALPQVDADEECNRDWARDLIETARREGRTLLDEYESKQVMAAYGIPVTTTMVATHPEEAIAHAEKIGYPVVVKIYSRTITHKTDVGGVKLNLRTPEEVKDAFETIQRTVAEKADPSDFMGVTVQPMERLEGYEIILGSSVDPQFGPVLLFGQGGALVEVMKDSAVGLPPLNTTLARRLMEQTKIHTALKGVRGRGSADMERLEQVLVQFSNLVAEQVHIKEIDINPMLVSEHGMVAVDARVVLYPMETPEEDLPKLAIRPYPMQYIKPWKTRDGADVTIRPIRPEDEPLLIKFHEALSEASVFSRYFENLSLSQRTAHGRLTRICFNDYDREIALVVDRKVPETGEHELLASIRLMKDPEPGVAEFLMIVRDDWQHKGIGSKLVETMFEVAAAEKVTTIQAAIMAESKDMLALCERLGFTLEPLEDGKFIKVVKAVEPEAVKG